MKIHTLQNHDGVGNGVLCTSSLKEQLPRNFVSELYVGNHVVYGEFKTYKEKMV